jgi:hypothetical protein
MVSVTTRSAIVHVPAKVGHPSPAIVNVSAKNVAVNAPKARGPAGSAALCRPRAA